MLLTLHMQEDILRHLLIMHASNLDTCFKVREDVEDIARASEAASGVVAMQISAVKGKSNKSKSKSEFILAEKERDGVKKLAKKNKDTRCFYNQKKDHVKCDC